ncbi:hypothetical protein [Fusibacter ferrireducens]|uniref:Uncharacterized protein n=1 Tax=Fusibacter ferrireducens TaxID=2785058 RepID=A0ABS0A018_9FIRM|nr:hypothetical protein [Fusibacter ferrireducens]MBF4696038.1 hypothetical protein [Fusibacter ferrireducens]
MGKISKQMVISCYENGKKVHKGLISRTDGKVFVNQETGMDIGSANDYITVLMAMLDGIEYHRTINAMATQYFLDNIKIDFGIEAQQIAAKATILHTKYYSTLGHGRQRKVEEIANRVLEK